MARKKSTELSGSKNPSKELENLRRRVNKGENIKKEEKPSKSRKQLDKLLADQQAKDDAAAIARDVNSPASKRGAKKTEVQTGIVVRESTKAERRRPQAGGSRTRTQSGVDVRKMANIQATLDKAMGKESSKRAPKKPAASKSESGPKAFGVVGDAASEEKRTAASGWNAPQAELNTAGFPEVMPAGEEYKLDEAYRSLPKGGRPGAFGGMTTKDALGIGSGGSEHLMVLHNLASRLTHHLNTLNDITQRTLPGAYYEDLNHLTKISTSLWHHLGMAQMHEANGEVLEPSAKSLRTNPFKKPVLSEGLTDAQSMYESTESPYRETLRSLPSNEVVTGSDDAASAVTAVDHAKLAAKHIGTLSAGLEALSRHISGTPAPVEYFAKQPAKKKTETDVAGFEGRPVSVPEIPTFSNSITLKSGKTERFGEAAAKIANAYEVDATEAANPNNPVASSLVKWRQNNPFGDAAGKSADAAEAEAHNLQQRIELGLPPHSRLTIGEQEVTIQGSRVVGRDSEGKAIREPLAPSTIRIPGTQLSNTEEADYRATQPKTKAPMGAVGPLRYASGMPTASQGMSFVGPPEGMDRDDYNRLVKQLVSEGKLNPRNTRVANWGTSISGDKVVRNYIDPNEVKQYHDFIIKEHLSRGGVISSMTSPEALEAARATAENQRIEKTSLPISARPSERIKNSRKLGLPTPVIYPEPLKQPLLPGPEQQVPERAPARVGSSRVGLAPGADIKSTYTPAKTRRTTGSVEEAPQAAPAKPEKYKLNSKGVPLLTTKQYMDSDDHPKAAIKLYEDASQVARAHWLLMNPAPKRVEEALPDLPRTSRGEIDASRMQDSDWEQLGKVQDTLRKHSIKWAGSLAATDPHAYAAKFVTENPTRTGGPIRAARAATDKAPSVPGTNTTSRAAKNLAAFRGE